MIRNDSWLYHNGVRSYPLHDRADVGSYRGLSDMHLAFPFSLSSDETASVYVRRLVVSDTVAKVEVYLDGTGLIAQADILDPEPYRLYLLSGELDGVRGFVTLGPAAESGNVDLTLDSSSGKILDSLVYRYESPPIESIVADEESLSGDVVLSGIQGLVCEVTDVYYDGEGQIPSMVIRMERDIETLTAPIPDCKRYLESASDQQVVTSINGVTPDDEGIIYLEFSSAYNYQFDASGHVPTSGGLYLTSTIPMAELISGEDNFLTFRDNFNYHLLCVRQGVQITYPTEKCVYCQPSDIGTGMGHDAYGGIPIAYGGAYINGNTLVIYWDFYGRGQMQPGPNRFGVTIDMESTAPVSVVGLTSIQGQSPKLPGKLADCQLSYASGGNPGIIGRSTYQLSRSVANGERFSLSIESGVVQDTNPLGGNGAGNKAVETCTLVAQNPE